MFDLWLKYILDVCVINDLISIVCFYDRGDLLIYKKFTIYKFNTHSVYRFSAQ